MLWYVLLRERNLLATQKEETRRMGADRDTQMNKTKLYHVRFTSHFFIPIVSCFNLEYATFHQVRKSMARIKQVLNERRIAYDKAHSIASVEYEAFHNAKVLNHLKRLNRQEKKAKLAAAKAAAVKKAAAKAAAKATAAKAAAEATAEATAKATAEAAAEATAKAAQAAAQKPPITYAEMLRNLAGETATAGLFGSTKTRRKK
jgi:large subunit ribosomal protein L47